MDFLWQRREVRPKLGGDLERRHLVPIHPGQQGGSELLITCEEVGLAFFDLSNSLQNTGMPLIISAVHGGNRHEAVLPRRHLYDRSANEVRPLQQLRRNPQAPVRIDDQCFYLRIHGDSLPFARTP